MYDLCPVPADEGTILRFIAFGHTQKWSTNTIQVYLAAVTALHKLNGYPPVDYSNYQIKLALRAVKQQNPATKHCHPITMDLLTSIIGLLNNTVHEQLWSATLTLGYFGALRGAEYTAVPGENGLLAAPTVSQLSFTTHLGLPAMH